MDFDFNRALDEAHISYLDIQEKINDRLKDVDGILKDVAEKKINNLSLTTIVEREVQRVVPDKVLKLLANQTNE